MREKARFLAQPDFGKRDWQLSGGFSRAQGVGGFEIENMGFAGRLTDNNIRHGM
jgi:hypothetical protein